MKAWPYPYSGARLSQPQQRLQAESAGPFYRVGRYVRARFWVVVDTERRSVLVLDSTRLRLRQPRSDCIVTAWSLFEK